jgi:small subunit ribosomal protein S20
MGHQPGCGCNGWFERGPQVGISFVVGVLRPALEFVGLPWVRNPPAPHPTRPEPERGFRVANIKSQIKRNKQNEKARQRNKAAKSALKTAVRKFREAADAGDVDGATVAMRTASQSLDKAASKGVIHKNQAANRKSAMATRCAELSKT